MTKNQLKNPILMLSFILILAIIIFIGVSISGKNRGEKLAGFAQCLKDKGAVFYGAFWCPHCQDQKALFGSSQKYLPYVECSTPDGNGQLPICQEKNITGYPTWIFSNGKIQSGGLDLKTLATESGCLLSQ